MSVLFMCWKFIRHRGSRNFLYWFISKFLQWKRSLNAAFSGATFLFPLISEIKLEKRQVCFRKNGPRAENRQLKQFCRLQFSRDQQNIKKWLKISRPIQMFIATKLLVIGLMPSTLKVISWLDNEQVIVKSNLLSISEKSILANV